MPGCWEAQGEKPRRWLPFILSYADDCMGLAHRGGHQLLADRTEGLSDTQQHLITVTSPPYLNTKDQVAQMRRVRILQSGPPGPQQPGRDPEG